MRSTSVKLRDLIYTDDFFVLEKIYNKIRDLFKALHISKANYKNLLHQLFNTIHLNVYI